MKQEDNVKDWNMAIAYLQQLDNRRNEFAEAYTSNEDNHLLRCFRNLWIQYKDIYFKIKEDPEGKEKREKIEKWLSDMKNILYKTTPTHKELVSVEEMLQECSIYINNLMYDYDLIFGKKEVNKSISEMIDEDYV